MSRTIVTKSDSEFFTNINSEQLLGELCKRVGAKYYGKNTSKPNNSNYDPRLSYSMTKEETIQAAEGLKTLLGQEDELLIEYRGYFDEDSNPETVTEFLEYYIKCFEDSHGYECV